MRKSILGHSLTGLLTDTILKRYIFILILGIFSLGSMANPKLASKQQIGMFINIKDFYSIR
jgi:hypothetical protein